MNIRLFSTLLLACLCTLTVACGDSNTTPPGTSDVLVGSDVTFPDTTGSDSTVCTPDCVGKVCGDDGCGGSCGTCVGGTSCGADGQCQAACVPDCTDKNCGGDGCGGFCGECGVGLTCSESGVCESACVPQCDGKVCGDDGCGGVCGQCAVGETCTNGSCEGASGECGDVTYEGCCDNGVLKSCDNGLQEADCGPDNTCGWNAEGSYYDCGFEGADPSGANPINCGEECVPSCFGKFCGSDGCGGSCGECGEGQACTEAGVCEDCTASCDGKTCGDDGCGGSCGACDDGFNCEDGTCVDPNAECGGITYEGCCNNGVLKYCENGLQEVDCVGLGSTCGWNADDGAYFCGSEGADPSGTFPIDCAACVPDCSAKFCGDDGCGGSCGECADGESCNAQFQCEGVICTPDCEGKECGADGCGGQCGPDCGIGNFCDANGQCQACVPQCDGKSCGPDSCGGSCGTCGDGQTCDGDGQCVDGPCVADCEGKVCGSDGCGGTCGECDGGLTCSEGACVESASCEGLCGSYDAENNCQCDDFCFFIGDCCDDVCTTCADIFEDQCCEPSCEGKQCGDDGCGGSCGEPCAEGSYCNAEFQCVEEVCEPQCEGKQCGADGCGGTCGICDDNQGCTEDGQCVESAPELSGTWVNTYTFETPQAPYLDCQLTRNISSVGPSDVLCENCDYAWTVLITPSGTDCGEWIGEVEESTTQMGLDVASGDLYLINDETGAWGLFAGEGTVVGNVYTGSFSTGPVYYIDMNESGDYDEGEALDLTVQIGLTWTN